LNKTKKTFTVIALGVVALCFSMCSEIDETPPVITLIGPDSIIHILNQPYIDPGARALDDTEGDITSKLFIKVNVNENKVGDYLVNFRVVDEAGNEAVPVDRFVRVVNTSEKYSGFYNAYEKEVYPGINECSYVSFVRIDSTLNDRVIFKGFGCDTLLLCVADISDTIIVLPFQVILTGDIDFSVQGSGWQNDTVISIEYTRKSGSETTYTNAVFQR
jgi:hypothetical protein